MIQDLFEPNNQVKIREDPDKGVFIENCQWIKVTNTQEFEKDFQKGENAMNTLRVKEFLVGEDGVGVVEMILIIVVLIGLVILFRDNLTKLVKNIFEKINKQSDTV